jgi:hypothetical protein
MNDTERELFEAGNRQARQRLAKITAMGITATKNAKNPFYKSKYAPLDVVVDVLKEPLSEAKLSYYFYTTTSYIGIEVIDLESGEDVLGSLFPLGNISTPQDMGKAISYAKRYLLKTVFNVIEQDEDDDGNEASGIVADAKIANEKKKPNVLDKPNKKLAQDDFFI